MLSYSSLSLYMRPNLRRGVYRSRIKASTVCKTAHSAIALTLLWTSRPLLFTKVYYISWIQTICSKRRNTALFTTSWSEQKVAPKCGAGRKICLLPLRKTARLNKNHSSATATATVDYRPINPKVVTSWVKSDSLTLHSQVGDQCLI